MERSDPGDLAGSRWRWDLSEAAPGRKDQAKLEAFFASAGQMSAGPSQIGLPA